MAIKMPPAQVPKTCMNVLDPSDAVVASSGMATAHAALLDAAVGVHSKGSSLIPVSEASKAG